MSWQGGAVRTRDRHGRGLRGPLVAATVRRGDHVVRVPLALSRSERFDELVTEVASAAWARWAAQLADVELAVEDVPPDSSSRHDGVIADETAGGPVPLGRLVRGHPSRVVVYRRPLEARAADRADLAALVREVVLDQVADLLGVDRDELG